MNILDRCLFPRRVNSNGEVIVGGWRSRFYQAVFERGISLPWFKSRDECSRYWQVPAGLTDRIDRPEDYATGPVGIMPHILSAVSDRVGRDEPVLEIGCNAGSKLNELRRAGFTQLAGLELNPVCFDVMERHFPELRRSVTALEGPAEKVLPMIVDGAYSWVYSISSLCMIHPSQSEGLRHIARVCRRVLLTLELEWAAGPHFFPRNYQRVFERLGFCQVTSTLITRETCPTPEMEAYWGHMMRVLVRTGA